jgi:hypothetical protein
MMETRDGDKGRRQETEKNTVKNTKRETEGRRKVGSRGLYTRY